MSKKKSQLEAKLLEAVTRDDIDQVKKLVARGADVNTTTRNNITPLMLAVRAPENKFALTSFLIKNGADVFAEDNEGKSAYDYIIEPPAPPEHHENAFEAWIYCEEHSIMNYINDHKMELFFKAIKNGDLEVIDMIAEKGLSISSALLLGRTPLMAAMSAKKSKLKIVKYLIEHKADILAKDYKGKTALDYLSMPPEPPPDDEAAHQAWLNCEEYRLKKYLLHLMKESAPQG
ncbi:ankyrin repeat domain-containing protein [candidate division CSSED10-310 bacterium]|uniref:Ankyrin repeat domain-containing protein n=1 Tax=candidate division CSSED10-310 bacterium TaxID=2855610 RepID=A0ABV6Z6J2_UNCC1